jgi:OOP family OmpA-OmpF porin
MPISDKVDLGLKYRFYNQSGRRSGERQLLDALMQSKFRSHSLMLTLGYNFGGRRSCSPAAASAAPAAAAPAAPSAAPAAAAAGGVQQGSVHRVLRLG